MSTDTCQGQTEAPKYIGVKIIHAYPAPCPAGGMGKYLEGDEGYTVIYEDGYQSWSPKEVFDNAYRPVDGMSFGLAIEAMKKGHKVQRKGWDGKDMWVVYMTPMHLPPYSTQGTVRKVNDRTANLIGPDTLLDTLGYFAMWTADKKWLPGWLASQTDMLADDWQIV